MKSFKAFSEDWDEHKHPRVPKGDHKGGQFTDKPKYIHYAKNKLKKIMKLVPNADYQPRDDMKPKGLWLSVGDAWKKWAEDEDFKTGSWQIQTEIVLKRDANILHISNAKELDEFTQRYKGNRFIDWKRVAEDYDGIIISPYIWSRRLHNHTMWYYGWDVASGCIWNPDVVKELR